MDIKEAARKLVYPYWREHVVEVSDCAKCVATRDSEVFRLAYTSDAVNGKASNALNKRACCLWAHSLSATQLAEKAMIKNADLAGLTKPVAMQLAKDFMQARTTALGQPHASDRTLDYQVTLYAVDESGHAQCVNARGESAKRVNARGKSANRIMHRNVYMGYRWQGNATL